MCSVLGAFNMSGLHQKCKTQRRKSNGNAWIGENHGAQKPDVRQDRRVLGSRRNTIRKAVRKCFGYQKMRGPSRSSLNDIWHGSEALVGIMKRGPCKRKINVVELLKEARIRRPGVPPSHLWWVIMRKSWQNVIDIDLVYVAAESLRTSPPLLAKCAGDRRKTGDRSASAMNPGEINAGIDWTSEFTGKRLPSFYELLLWLVWDATAEHGAARGNAKNWWSYSCAGVWDT